MLSQRSSLFTLFLFFGIWSCVKYFVVKSTNQFTYTSSCFGLWWCRSSQPFAWFFFNFTYNALINFGSALFWKNCLNKKTIKFCWQVAPFDSITTWYKLVMWELILEVVSLVSVSCFSRFSLSFARVARCADNLALGMAYLVHYFIHVEKASVSFFAHDLVFALK